MSQVIRTYSRKGKRVAKDASVSVDTSPDRSPVARKRQRIEVEVITDNNGSDTDTELKRKDGVEVEKDVVVSSSNSRVLRLDGHTTHKGDRQPSSTYKTSRTGVSLPSPGPTGAVARTAGPMKKAKSQLTTQPSVPPSLRHTQSLSPEKPNADFADYFGDINIRTNLSTVKTGGVAKRMLRRAHTESSVTSNDANDSYQKAGPSVPRTPTKLTATKPESIIDLTSGSPGSSRNLPLTPSKSRSQEDTLSPDKVVRATLVSSNVRTYAGKSRSFLVALPTSRIASVDQESTSQVTDIDNLAEDDEYETRESYADLRARWGVDDSEDDPFAFIEDLPSPSKDYKVKGKQKQVQPPVPRLPPGMMNDLKSITELRSKGESRRFLDDVGYLFEGLGSDGALGVRRGSALEIVTKLCDPDFARKAKAADFLGRAWEGLREAGAGEGDKVLDSILVFFAALVSRDPVDATDLATRLDFRPTLLRLLAYLTHDNDPLWLVSCGLQPPALRASGIARNDVSQLTGLQNMILNKSGLFDESEIISNRLLISLSLAALPPSVHHSTGLPIILSSLEAELVPLSARVSAYVAGLPLLPAVNAESHADLPSLSHIDNYLRLLDTYLLGRWEEDDAIDGVAVLDNARKNGFGSTLLTLCVAVDVISRTHDTPFLVAAAQKCIESALRVLVNLTHDSLPWCQASIGSSDGLPSILRLLATLHSQKTRPSTAERSEEGDYEAASYLDRLCLILGLVTNLVQTSDEAKEHIRDLKLAPRCPGLRPCAVACRCAEAVSALDCLVQIYEQPGHSENDFESVVRGHIAVLFGLLMQGHPRNQLMLLRLLSGPSNRKKVESVMENVREFTLLYAEFVKRAAHAAEADDDDDDQESRQGDVESALRASHGELVVRRVLSFLENLLQGLND